MSAVQKAGVIQFYDTHPINEDEILAKLSARGTNVETLSEDELKDFDQDHYGGVHVVDVLADKAGIRREHHVLDVCSGMGGPARWIAYRYGCRVTGLDFTESRVEAAKRLTQRVRLDHVVDFVHGDATAMPLPDARYDVLIGQESWVHIPDKAALIQQCARVVKPAGTIAFTDIVLRAQLTRGEEDRLTAEIHAPQVASADRYEKLLANNGYRVKVRDDLLKIGSASSSIAWRCTGPCAIQRSRSSGRRAFWNMTVRTVISSVFLSPASLAACASLRGMRRNHAFNRTAIGGAARRPSGRLQ